MIQFMKMKNNSPWLHQLNKDREAKALDKDLETDVAIVGGGIAGISTSFFILRNTDKKVVLLEGGRLAHGATGHNAGQITSYFSRSLTDLSKEFSEDMVIDAQKNIEEHAWQLIDEMYTEAGLDIPISRFVGHLGLYSKEHLTILLEDNLIRERHGLLPKEISVAREADFLPGGGKKFDGFYKEVKQEELLKKLETDNKQFTIC